MMPQEKPRSRPVIWFEVKDFIEYFEVTPRPSGIQRVQWEIFRRSFSQPWPRGSLRFCRIDEATQNFREVAAATVASTFLHPPLTRFWLPPIPGETARQRTWRELRLKRGNQWRQFKLDFQRRWTRVFARSDMADETDGAPVIRFQPGDILVSVTGNWPSPVYIEAVTRQKRERGLQFATFVHDLIPVAYPQFVERESTESFERWIDGLIDIADLFLTVSISTREALLARASVRDVALAPVVAVKLGASFHAQAPERSRDDDAIAALPQPFVLFVSTLEIRKNHLLMLRVWERLIAKHGAEQVPRLVLIGRFGWLIDELLAKLAATAHLGGKIVHFQNVSDQALHQAYRDCLFTVYPSFAEGWGLPIAESLEAGKLCIASNRTSMPEVGGPYADYIDPDNEDDAFVAIERAMFEPGYREAREAEIRAGYHPPEWSDSFETMLARLDLLAAAALEEPSVAETADVL